MRVCLRFYPFCPYLTLYLPSSFSLCIAFCPLFFFALVVFCLSSCLVFPALSLCLLFPFRYMRKKKGRKVFPLRPLLSCCELLYLRIAAAFLSATAAALWHSWSEPKNGGMCGNSGIKAIKQSFKGCFSIFANLNDFINWKFFLSPFRFICSVPP